MALSIPTDYDSFFLQTNRLILRHPRKTDCAAWLRERNANYDYLSCWEPTWPMEHLTYNGFHAFCDFSKTEHESGNSLNFLIMDTDNKTVMGGAEVVRLSGWPVMSCMVGYWISERYRGQGLMPEALKILCTWLQGTLKVIRVEAVCMLSNQPSHQVLRKVGFKEEGILRDFAEINGKMEDHVIFGLTPRDRLPASGGFGAN